MFFALFLAQTQTHTSFWEQAQGIYAVIGLAIIVGTLAIAIKKRLTNKIKRDRAVHVAIEGIQAEGHMGGVPGLLERTETLEGEKNQILLILDDQNKALEELKLAQESNNKAREHMATVVADIQVKLDTVLERSESLTHNGGSSMADQSLRGDILLRKIAEKLNIEIPPDLQH